MDSSQENSLDIIDDLNDLVVYGDESLLSIDTTHGFPAPILSLEFYFDENQKKLKHKFCSFIDDTKYHYPDYDIMKLDTVEISSIVDDPNESDLDEKKGKSIGIIKMGVVNCSMANYTMNYNLKEMTEWAFTVIAYFKELIKEEV